MKVFLRFLWEWLWPFVSEERRRRARVEAMRVEPHAKCPACGHRSGAIRFDSSLQLIVHTCQICTAAWGEKPIVEVKAWQTL